MDVENEIQKPLGARLGEAFFCILYLSYMIFLAVLMKQKYENGVSQIDDLYLIPEYMDVYRYSFGFMLAVLLVGGDAFHLIPRIIINFRGSIPKQDFFLGFGNFISSLTMTVFYNVLIGMADTLEYSETEYNYPIESAILIFSLIRFVIIMLPLNGWYSGKPNRRMAVLRNIPFAIIGCLTAVGLLEVMAHAHNYHTGFYNIILISVIFSFIFYMPVAIFGKEKPKLGILMIPKTICYMIMMSVICFF